MMGKLPGIKSLFLTVNQTICQEQRFDPIHSATCVLIYFMSDETSPCFAMSYIRLSFLNELISLKSLICKFVKINSPTKFSL